MITAVAIGAPIAGVAVIGTVVIFLYKKKTGCFRRAGRARRGSLLDDFEIEGWKNTQYTTQYQDKFDPAKNY